MVQQLVATLPPPSPISDHDRWFPVFQAAIGRHDEDAWAALYHKYYALVLTWVRDADYHSQLEGEDYLSIVNVAWAKFARAMTPQKLSGFTQIAMLMAYLKLCARSGVQDEIRAQRNSHLHESIELVDWDQWQPEEGNDPADGILDELWNNDLWHIVTGAAITHAEHIIVEERLRGGLKPQELARRYPEVFCNVETVYRMHHTFMERLARNRQLRAFVMGNDEEKGA